MSIDIDASLMPKKAYILLWVVGGALWTIAFIVLRYIEKRENDKTHKKEKQL